MPSVTWQAPGAPPSDPFAAIEADVRALTSSPWWMGAVPQQRAEAITGRMLAGAGEWWLFGVWGRWYRCGLDGNWHLCPPPFDPAARQGMLPAQPGAGRPPVPPSLLPTVPDLIPGPLAGDGLFGAPPPTPLLGRMQQVLTLASGVNPAQFPMRDPHFVPGTPSPVAVCFLTVLWCAGAPVADPDHPLFGLFAPYLTAAEPGPRWFLPPDLPLIVGAYTERLRANDPAGAAHIARTIWETAETLRADPAFRPRADAMSAMAGASLQMIAGDHGGVWFGDAAVVQEWVRRCPPALRVSLLREVAPGDHFRLACYDLAAAAAPLPAAAAGPAEERRVAFALLAADLDGAPGAAAAVMPWLDPDGARTLQALGRSDHPLRALWPVDGTLPAAVAGAEPQILRALLAASYAIDLAWCRLAGTPPPRPGFTVPSALITAILAGPDPTAGGNLTPWEIIEAARAHLAEQRQNEAPQPAPEGALPATTAWPASEPLPPASAEPAAAPPEAPGATTAWPSSEPVQPVPPTASAAVPSSAEPAGATTAWPGSEPLPSAGASGRVVEAYGVSYIPGEEDVDRLLTELRRRGTWAHSLRGQAASGGSAPAVLLVGAVSCGQRRLTRMITRALADAEVNGGEVRVLAADELDDIDPRQLRERLAEHDGHTLLIEGLDTLILDDDRGAAYASALYRARVEGVSDTTLAATCAPERLAELTEANPELITDFRQVRMPDLSDPELRVELAALLAAERHLELTDDAWRTARRDLAALRGRGRLINARLVEAYLDRACSRHLSRAGETQVFRGGAAMTLTAADFESVADELEPRG